MANANPTRAILAVLRRDGSAATAIEYSLIAALISILGFVLYTNIGGSVAGLFQSVGDSF